MRHCARLTSLPSWALTAGFTIALVGFVGYWEIARAARPEFLDNQVTPKVCRQCASNQCECELICCPEMVTETEKKSFWKVTCEYVCIPGFRFPWECKTNNACDCEYLICGRVRAVSVLEQEEYECETCGYKWGVKCVRRTDESRVTACQCPRCADQARARLAAEKRPSRN